MNYTVEELRAMGVRCGEDVRVHRSVVMFEPQNITIGNQVRIDAQCILSAGAGITIGSFSHIACGCYFFAARPILLEDYASTSSRVTIYTASDDYRDGYLAGPMVPLELRKVHEGPVVLRKHALIGANTVILPDVELGEGCAVGAMSLVTRSIPAFAVAGGVPAKPLKERNRARIAEMEARHRALLQNQNGAR